MKRDAQIMYGFALILSEILVLVYFKMTTFYTVTQALFWAILQVFFHSSDKTVT